MKGSIRAITPGGVLEAFAGVLNVRADAASGIARDVDQEHAEHRAGEHGSKKGFHGVVPRGESRWMGATPRHVATALGPSFARETGPRRCEVGRDLEASRKNAHDHEDQQDDENEAEAAGRAVAPFAAVPPGGEGADEENDDDNEQNESQVRFLWR